MILYGLSVLHVLLGLNEEIELAVNDNAVDAPLNKKRVTLIVLELLKKLNYQYTKPILDCLVVNLFRTALVMRSNFYKVLHIVLTTAYDFLMDGEGLLTYAVLVDNLRMFGIAEDKIFSFTTVYDVVNRFISETDIYVDSIAEIIRRQSRNSIGRILTADTYDTSLNQSLTRENTIDTADTLLSEEDRSGVDVNNLSINRDQFMYAIMSRHICSIADNPNPFHFSKTGRSYELPRDGILHIDVIIEPFIATKASLLTDYSFGKFLEALCGIQVLSTAGTRPIDSETMHLVPDRRNVPIADQSQSQVSIKDKNFDKLHLLLLSGLNDTQSYSLRDELSLSCEQAEVLYHYVSNLKQLSHILVAERLLFHMRSPEDASRFLIRNLYVDEVRF